MGFHQEQQIAPFNVVGVMELPPATEPRWVSEFMNAGIQLRAPLKPVLIASRYCGDNDHNEPTTPTAAESRISVRDVCPPAPRKRKAPSGSAWWRFDAGREFFVPADLESVFVRRHVKRAK
ncbi:hypothetical protein Droror1_Dr00018642 [Drosera rotundifolia]